MKQAFAHDVVSPAYDALSVAQRQTFRSDHPDSYLHITRSAADEPDAATVDHATLVARGREALERLVERDLFVTHSDPAFYVYRLAESGHEQFGLVCEVEAEHFATLAKPHEATQPERAALLAEHFMTVRAASSPVACAVRDEGELAALLAEAAAVEPVLNLVGDDGLHQSVWRVEDPDLQRRLHRRVDDQALFIIDGHHRAAANQQLLDAGHPVPVLAAIFPQQSLSLVGFHRLLKLPVGLDEAALIRAIERRFPVHRISDVASVEPGSVALFAASEWQIVDFDERPISGGAQIRLGSLDPVVLEREILTSIVGSYGDYSVSYTADTEPFAEIAAAAASEGLVPFFVPPVDIDDMMAVADGGLIMPAKSTYFTPKVRSGLFLRLL